MIQYPGQLREALDPDAPLADLVRDGLPCIYTSKGNLPLQALDYQPVWETGDGYIKFIERHYYKGELVREAAHVFTLRSLTATGGISL